MTTRYWIAVKVDEEGWLVCQACGAREHSVSEPISHKPECRHYLLDPARPAGQPAVRRGRAEEE